jgi:hypothetical protein
MKNNTKMKVPKKYQHMIDCIDYEGEDGYWAYAKKGYRFWLSDGHIAHEKTQKDLLNTIRTLEVCNCEECKDV